jgi:hypothetical protein
METNFKVGDRVYDIVWGWGIVTVTNRSVEVKFDSGIYQSYKKDGRYAESSKPTLSFTKYTLQGFSQERPIILPEIGELCLVRRCNTDKWFLDKFHKFESGYYYCENNKWEQIKRIKILD